MEKPAWVELSDKSNDYLSSALTFAMNSYFKHTEWHLNHQQTGVRNLAAVLTVEFTLIGLHFSQFNVPSAPTVFVLGLLSIVSPVLVLSACRSCFCSYRACLETAVFATKLMWAMGLVEKVSIDKTIHMSENIPVKDDKTLFVPRFWISAYDCKTTFDFVEKHLHAKHTTYFWSKVTIGLFGLGAFLGGLVGVVMVLW